MNWNLSGCAWVGWKIKEQIEANIKVQRHLPYPERSAPQPGKKAFSCRITSHRLRRVRLKNIWKSEVGGVGWVEIGHLFLLSHHTISHSRAGIARDQCHEPTGPGDLGDQQTRLINHFLMDCAKGWLWRYQARRCRVICYAIVTLRLHNNGEARTYRTPAREPRLDSTRRPSWSELSKTEESPKLLRPLAASERHWDYD